MRKSILYTTVTLSIWLLAGCGKDTYRWEAFTMSSPPGEFQPEVLTQEPLAVLPVLTPNRLQGYGIGLSQALNQTFSECYPTIKAIPSSESVIQISRSGIEKELDGLGEDWKTYTVHSRVGLETIGSALGVRYMLIPSLADSEFEIKDRFVFLGFRAVQTRTEGIKLALQLWDVTSGDILWESFGEGIITRDVLSEGPGSTGTLAMFLWRSMIEDLLQGKKTSYSWDVEIYSRPCPGAPE